MKKLVSILKFQNSNTCETNINNLTENDVNKVYEECVTKTLEIPVTTFSFFENGTLNDLYQPNKNFRFYLEYYVKWNKTICSNAFFITL